MALTDIGKSISIVWEFPDLNTRFVFNNHDGLSHGAYTVYEGAEPRNEVGSEFDLNSGRITLSRSDFSVVDENEAISAWLTLNDSSLHETRVVRYLGLYGDAESTYQVTQWELEDWRIGSSMGGEYLFELQNVYRVLSQSLYDGIGGKGVLNDASYVSGLPVGDTSFILEDAPSDAWPDEGYGILYDTNTRECELFTYAGKSPTSPHLTGITRRVFGVGYNGGTSKVFQPDATELYHVWVRRGNPINVMLDLMTANNAGWVDIDTPPAEAWLNPSWDNWTGSTPDSWTKSETTGAWSEETVDTLVGSAARWDFGGSGGGGNGSLDQSVASAIGPTEFFRLSVLLKASFNSGDYSWTASSATQYPVMLIIQNVTTGNYLKADGTWGVAAGDDQGFHLPATTDWEYQTVVFQGDSGGAGSDTYNVKIKVQGDAVSADLANEWVLFDADAPLVFGPFASNAVNGPYDTGGDGANCPLEYINLPAVIEQRQALTADPVFDGTTGAVSSGTGILLVEKEPIDDLKQFMEQYILRPFAFKPSVDSMERFTVVPYFQVPPPETTIGDKWIRKNFSASSWTRNYSSKINNCRLLSDWDTVKGEHDLGISFQNTRSINSYGKGKKVEIQNRGGRTGQKGFPDYGSQADLATAANRIMLEGANPWTSFDIEVFYEFRDLVISDSVRLNLPQLIDLSTGARGQVDKLYFVDRKLVENARGKVRIRIRERRPILRPAFIGSNSAANNYTAASATEKENNCYLTGGSESQFDNGNEGYTVVG